MNDFNFLGIGLAFVVDMGLSTFWYSPLDLEKSG
jgi:hypothetical protein|tara:strand:- start:55 stop:156 length:102 start_codon:yes stop_codon:yes gene_type:complete